MYPKGEKFKSNKKHGLPSLSFPFLHREYRHVRSGVHQIPKIKNCPKRNQDSPLLELRPIVVGTLRRPFSGSLRSMYSGPLELYPFSYLAAACQSCGSNTQILHKRVKAPTRTLARSIQILVASMGGREMMPTVKPKVK